MRAVIQRVSEASVRIEGSVKGAIGRGMLVLLGVAPEDTQEDVQWLAGKVARMRIFSDANGLMNLGLEDVGGEVLVVSQFTLFASTKKGNRPGYSAAALPAVAIPLYESFVKILSGLLGKAVPTGEFGADMQIGLINDGPVTILIDSRRKE